ncbi:MAG: hypothetical protein KDA84_16130, partial [Planctomycetaceae bacterium]|nr:hypothetical protein [Planctomycetaceae bacterium]
MIRLLRATVGVFYFFFIATCVEGEILPAKLNQAGQNRGEIEQALTRIAPEQLEGLEFLVENMPERDLTTLSADFLLENTRLAYQAWRQDPWAKRVPKTIFLNNVLPYASVNERRDNWRADFRQRFLPMVKNAKSPSEVATILNREIFKTIGVKYSTKRKKADQSPYESIEQGLASCSGLSILLIDACRSVGVPARFVGTPLWTNKTGNHSWVEIWDEGWHFTGAAEPTGDQLDRGWFVARTSTAIRDNPLHAIYATSFKKTPLSFPCVWDPRIRYISAVNVTDRYVALKKPLPPGQVRVLFDVRDEEGGRCACEVSISQNGKSLFHGLSKDDRFDANDHLSVPLKQGQKYLVQAKSQSGSYQETIEATKQDSVVSIQLQKQPTANQDAVALLKKYLSLPPDKRPALLEQAFATLPLNRQEVDTCRKLLAKDRLQQIRSERIDEWNAKVLSYDGKQMPFAFRKFGKKPKDGHSLYISLHGGGGAPAKVNDRQWENQKRLYELEEGIYVAPRAPTNTWNLWHQSHIDPLFDRLIETFVAFENVNWNRVYVLGYSAGGDGVYQLAPRMADRWAAAAMMAGHPNETSPLGLRNLPFALQVGGKDAAYKRNQVAQNWKEQLAKLHRDDPKGYTHFVKIYPNKGHWMDREDAVAIPWMAKFQRNPTPKRVVWKQDDVTHSQFYWLGVDQKNRKARTEVTAEVDSQVVTLSAKQLEQITVYLDDRLIDLDRSIKIESEGTVLFEGKLVRTIAGLWKTFNQRRDPDLSFPSSVTVTLPKPFPQSLVPNEDLPKYAALRCQQPPKIDGKLDEPAWRSVQKTKSFVDLIGGQPTIHETRAGILWDDDYLYIGFWVSDPDVQAKYKNRDDPIYYDNDVEVFIAGKNAYYEFEINPFGTIYEGFFIWDDAYEKDGFAADPQLKRSRPKTQAFHGV